MVDVVDILNLCTRCKKFPKELTRSKNYCINCLEYSKKKYKDYYAKLPKEKRQQIRRIYYQKNKKEIISKTIIYNKTHPEIRKKTQQKYSRKNKDYLNQKSKEYKLVHRKRYNEHNRLWRKLHPERAKIDAEIRRARLQNVGGTFSENEWKALCEKYNYSCLSCHRNDVRLTIDHIIPISKGGANIIENIQPLCKSCNSKKSTKIIDYR